MSNPRITIRNDVLTFPKICDDTTYAILDDILVDINLGSVKTDKYNNTTWGVSFKVGKDRIPVRRIVFESNAQAGYLLSITGSSTEQGTSLSCTNVGARTHPIVEFYRRLYDAIEAQTTKLVQSGSMVRAFSSPFNKNGAAYAYKNKTYRDKLTKEGKEVVDAKVYNGVNFTVGVINDNYISLPIKVKNGRTFVSVVESPLTLKLAEKYLDDTNELTKSDLAVNKIRCKFMSDHYEKAELEEIKKLVDEADNATRAEKIDINTRLGKFKEIMTPKIFNELKGYTVDYASVTLPSTITDSSMNKYSVSVKSYINRLTVSVYANQADLEEEEEYEAYLRRQLEDEGEDKQPEVAGADVDLE